MKIDIIGSIIDRKIDVYFFYVEMSLAATQLVHLSSLVFFLISNQPIDLKSLLRPVWVTSLGYFIHNIFQNSPPGTM